MDFYCKEKLPKNNSKRTVSNLSSQRWKRRPRVTLGKSASAIAGGAFRHSPICEILAGGFLA